MTLVLLALVAAVFLAVICGGRPATFGRPPVNHLGLLGVALVSVATSSLAKFPGVCVGWLVTAMLAMIWFGAANRGRPGIGLIVVGLGLNVLVIIVNAGMPVSMNAVLRAGVPPSSVQLDTDPLREELTDETVLPWLGEAVPLALPFRPAVASPGDVLVAAGVALLVFTGWTGIGRTVPDRVLTPSERKARRRQRQAEKAALAEASAGQVTVPVLAAGEMRPDDDNDDSSPPPGTALDDGEVPAAKNEARIVMPAGAVIPSLVVLPLDADPETIASALADAASSVDESVIDAPEPVDPVVAAAAAAAAAEDAEFKRLKRLRKKRKRKRRRAEADAAALVGAAKDDDADAHVTALVGAAKDDDADADAAALVGAAKDDDADAHATALVGAAKDDEAEADEEAPAPEPPVAVVPESAQPGATATAPSAARPSPARQSSRTRLAAVPGGPGPDDNDVVTEIRPRGLGLERNGRPDNDPETVESPPAPPSSTAAPEDRPAI